MAESEGFLWNYPFKQAFPPPMRTEQDMSDSTHTHTHTHTHTQAHLEMCEFTYSPRGLEFSQESMSLHCIKSPSEYIGAKRWGKASRTTSMWLAPAEKMRMLRTALILDLPRITIINSSSNLIVVIRSTHQLGN